MAVITLPAFHAALRDRALRGNARDVYLWLFDRLDILDYRPVKLAEIEQGLGIDDPSVRFAIGRLIERGYVSRGPRDGRVWTYRLTWSPLNPVSLR